MVVSVGLVNVTPVIRLRWRRPEEPETHGRRNPENLFDSQRPRP